jgi:beta-lactamase superfamily II metal-dependent hydrolase
MCLSLPRASRKTKLTITKDAISYSAGRQNKYGHTAPETLQTLQEVGARIYRTDINGTVEVIADQEQMWVRSER